MAPLVGPCKPLLRRPWHLLQRAWTHRFEGPSLLRLQTHDMQPNLYLYTDSKVVNTFLAEINVKEDKGPSLPAATLAWDDYVVNA